MENLEKLIYDLYKKNARQCTNEEIYNALLIYTKNQLFEKGYHNGKKKIYYISAEFLIGKLLSNNLINLGIYDDVAAFRISQKLGQHGTYQFLSVELHSLFRIISGDIPIRSVRLFVHIKNFPHNCRFPGFFHKLLCMDSFHQDLL